MQPQVFEAVVYWVLEVCRRLLKMFLFKLRLALQMYNRIYITQVWKTWTFSGMELLHHGKYRITFLPLKPLSQLPLGLSQPPVFEVSSLTAAAGWRSVKMEHWVDGVATLNTICCPTFLGAYLPLPWWSSSALHEGDQDGCFSKFWDKTERQKLFTTLIMSLLHKCLSAFNLFRPLQRTL